MEAFWGVRDFKTKGYFKIFAFVKDDIEWFSIVRQKGVNA